MCVLIFAWRAHPRWPLVIAGNRDELHARPAAPLARWGPPDGLIAGRDLQSGGTWLGVSEQGRFAVVTNLRGYGAPLPEPTSRGALVTGLLGGAAPFDHVDRVELDGFNPFNLIFADTKEAWFLSNRPEALRSRLAPGVYGLSNGSLDEPWPKTLQLKAHALGWIVDDGKPPEALLDALGDEQLPQAGIAPALPSDVVQEPALSPIFIRNAIYGTRCSTVVAIDAKGSGLIAERRYDASGQRTGETALTFCWP